MIAQGLAGAAGTAAAAAVCGGGRRVGASRGRVPRVRCVPRSPTEMMSSSSSSSSPSPPLESAGELTIRRKRPQSTRACGDVRFGQDDKYIVDEEVRRDLKPANILEEIVWSKEVEVDKMREAMPLPMVNTLIKNGAAPPARDFVGALREGATRNGVNGNAAVGLIAEVKKASPSKGVLRADFDPAAVARAYEAGGASCCSVLTDTDYFQGGFENLALIRRAGVACPLLCKEFIVYPYQIYYGRLKGADAILLIAAVLPDSDLVYYSKIAHSLGMQVLIEVHTLAELDRVLGLDVKLDMVGVNNRNLKDFSVDLNLTVELVEKRGAEIQSKGAICVGESGIFTQEHLRFLATSGVSAALVGESLIKEPDCELATKKLLGSS